MAVLPAGDCFDLIHIVHLREKRITFPVRIIPHKQRIGFSGSGSLFLMR